MTPDQIRLVRLSFVKVMDIKREAGRLFYERLFSIAPDVRPMFKGDIDAQATKLMDTMALAIGALKSPDALDTLLHGLARRHANYGVKDEHYDRVGEALLWTLKQGLGEAFTPEVTAAWTSLYTNIATAMKDAAAGPMAARA